MNKVSRSLLLFLFCCGTHSAGTTASESNYKSHPLPADTKLILPFFHPPHVEWAWPRLDPFFKERSDTHFDIDGDGNPWYSMAPQYLISPVTGMIVKVDVLVQDYVWLDNGELAVCSQDALGFLVNPDEPKNSVTLFHFEPAIPLVSKNTKLYAGIKNSLYLVGTDFRNGKETLFVIRNPITQGGTKTEKVMSKLLSIKEEITAVTGDGDTTYVAIGRIITRLKSGDSQAERIFVHSDLDILGLAAIPTGVFYTTHSSVGFVSFRKKKSLEFLKTPSPQIKLKKGKLYVMLGSTQEVLEFRNLDKFDK